MLSKVLDLFRSNDGSTKAASVERSLGSKLARPMTAQEIQQIGGGCCGTCFDGAGGPAGDLCDCRV